MKATVEQARCREVDPDMWFPDSGHWDVAADAKRICGTCPLLEACLEYALTAEPAVLGIWGATNFEQRRVMRRRRGIRLSNRSGWDTWIQAAQAVTA